MTKIIGKTALITGASGGIGRAIALELALAGAKRLLLVGRNLKKLTQLAQEIEIIGCKTVIFCLDLTKSDAVNITLAQAWRDYGPIDILVNCAGIAHQNSFLLTKPSEIEQEISLNLTAMYTTTRLIARRMVAQKQGIIINVSSLMGKIAAPTMSTYSATKFAILGFTQALRGELAPYNVKVVALLPTLTHTDMTTNLKPFRWVQSTTPESVGRSLIKGLQKGSAEIFVGWQTHLAVICQRLLPWLIEKIVFLAAPMAFIRENEKLTPKNKAILTQSST